MVLIRYSDDDRRRMLEEAAEHREVQAEWDRLCLQYSEVAHNPTTPAEIERERRLGRVRERLQIRPHGES